MSFLAFNHPNRFCLSLSLITLDLGNWGRILSLIISNEVKTCTWYWWDERGTGISFNSTQRTFREKRQRTKTRFPMRYCKIAQGRIGIGAECNLKYGCAGRTRAIECAAIAQSLVLMNRLNYRFWKPIGYRRMTMELNGRSKNSFHTSRLRLRFEINLQSRGQRAGSTRKDPKPWRSLKKLSIADLLASV